jgi:hypothetical protein
VTVICWVSVWVASVTSTSSLPEPGGDAETVPLRDGHVEAERSFGAGVCGRDDSISLQELDGRADDSRAQRIADGSVERLLGLRACG